MTQKYPNGEKIISPGTVIVSAGGEVSDVKKVVSPVLVNDAKSTIYHIDFSFDKLRLGECILWTVETIRLGQNASMGCKMVHVDAENYEGIYFLSDDEVLDASARYRRWWENRKYPRTMWTIDPCYDEPLCGSGYMWW